MSDNTALATRNVSAEVLETVLIGGDLSGLNPQQRVNYYQSVCESLGLNPLTKPFDYIEMKSFGKKKLVLYAKRDAAEQLRRINSVSITRLERTVEDGVCIVTAYASDGAGRTDASTGVVSIGNLKGDAKANALMKAETKAKRRVTLSICGLGWLDETEIETIRGAETVVVNPEGEIVEAEARTPAQAPAPQNGNSYGERPFEPEIVKDIIDKKIDKYSGKEANANQRGLLRGMLEELFAGEVDAEKKYRSVSMYLTGEDSTSSMSGAQVLALLDWIKPSKDDGGAYFSDPMAIKEAHQIEHAVLLDAGQTELPV